MDLSPQVRQMVESLRSDQSHAQQAREDAAKTLRGYTPLIKEAPFEASPKYGALPMSENVDDRRIPTPWDYYAALLGDGGISLEQFKEIIQNPLMPAKRWYEKQGIVETPLGVDAGFNDVKGMGK